MGEPLDRVTRINCKHPSHDRSSPCLTNLSFGRSKVNEQAFNILHKTVNIPFAVCGRSTCNKSCPDR